MKNPTVEIPEGASGFSPTNKAPMKASRRHHMSDVATRLTRPYFSV